jgi:predicted secreted Zn-dependent protease
MVLNDSALRRTALGHEQTHFDIAELHARRIRRYFGALPDACRKTDPELTELTQRLLREEKTEQQRYDAETQHGLRTAEQAAWSRDVARRLRGS